MALFLPARYPTMAEAERSWLQPHGPKHLRGRYRGQTQHFIPYVTENFPTTWVNFQERNLP